MLYSPAKGIHLVVHANYIVPISLEGKLLDINKLKCLSDFHFNIINIKTQIYLQFHTLSLGRNLYVYIGKIKKKNIYSLKSAFLPYAI